MSFWLNVLLIVVFQVIGAVFACTEMALVSLRDSQVEQMEQEDARGKKVAAIVRNPNRFLSAVQIGTTFTGFLGASFGASSLMPFLMPYTRKIGMSDGSAQVVLTIVLTFIISYFSIVISEMVPKRIAMQKTEQIARSVVPTVDAFATICMPLIWLISALTNLLVRALGFDPHATEQEVSDDELQVLVSTNTKLDREERAILEDVFDASETAVAEVMRPRVDVEDLEGTQTIEEAAAYVRNLPYSRYPVIGEDFDDVLGFVHVRDLLDVRDKSARIVADVTRKIMRVPGTAKLLPTLNRMRKESAHIAIVIDEYGGTDGIVTLEDLMEELIGEIHDEYDMPDMDAPKVTAVDGEKSLFVNGVASVDGGMTIEDFADATGIELEDGPYETVAGYFLAHTGTMASEGDTFHSDDNYDMIVTKVDGRRIQTIEIRTGTARNASADANADSTAPADSGQATSGKQTAESAAATQSTAD